MNHTSGSDFLLFFAHAIAFKTSFVLDLEFGVLLNFLERHEQSIQVSGCQTVNFKTDSSSCNSNAS